MYLVKVKDIDSNATITERQFNNRHEAIDYFDKQESAIVIDLEHTYKDSQSHKVVCFK